MKKFAVLFRPGITLLFFINLALIHVKPAFSQADVTNVVVTAVQANEAFPDVRVQAKAVDANGEFVPGIAASQFSIREDGEAVQIDEVTTAPLPLNLRVVFVIDEFQIAAHAAAVRDAIQFFAENQMQPGDQVEVLAASNNGETRQIIAFTDSPDEVFNGISDSNYNPLSASNPLLLDTINRGLADLSALNENTEGVNRMIVFSISINDARALNETVENAVQAGVPIHTVLLGSQDIQGALGRLASGSLAGEGPLSPEDLNDLFERLEAESVQDQYLISYRSKVNQAGEHDVVVTIGGVSSRDTAFPLDALEPPSVRITSPVGESVITRTETSFGQDPETIQPTEQTVAVEASWPDGHPREIVQEKTLLVVNGESLGSAVNIRDNGQDPVILEFTWDLRGENTPGETPLSIVIEAEDELGLKGVSEPLPITMAYVPVVVSNACPGLISESIPALCAQWDLIVSLSSLGIALAALVLVLVYLRRNPRVQQQVKERLGTMATRIGGSRPSVIPTGGNHMGTRLIEPPQSAKASLEVLEGKSGTSQTVFHLNATTSLGRSSDHAQLVLQSDQGDRSPISRLHCTILIKDEFFELRDEGSANGTFLNDVRIRSGELHRLGNGDTIELARALDGGLKLKFKAISRSTHVGTRLVEPEKKDSDELPKDGYTPTKLM